MRDNKRFKNLDEQIEIFRYKGLVVENEEFARNVLLKENYFFINGYRHLFMKSCDNKRYIEGTTFEEQYSLFLFDRSFRNIIFKYLLVIENNTKSIISYQLSKKYGYKESDYLKAKNFDTSPDKSRQVNDLISKMKRQVRVNGSQHSATRHYITNYGYIPLWVLVKVLSFGIISELYSILKKEDREAICDVYGIDSRTYSNYLPILANYRNLCAHEDILFCNRTQKIIDDTIYHHILNIEKTNDEYIYGKNDLFALLIIVKQLLSYTEIKNMSLEIQHVLDNLELNLKTIPITKVLNEMGFPENWKDIVEIN
ncbi:MAG: Abi family protein [Eubacteriales bacterium]|nr:Abi family protein [Eubacteriales bacterium]